MVQQLKEDPWDFPTSQDLRRLPMEGGRRLRVPVGGFGALREAEMIHTLRILRELTGFVPPTTVSVRKLEILVVRE